MKTKAIPLAERLFIGVYPGGLVYADRGREEHGDYARVAFLAYDDLTFRVDDPKSPLLAEAREHAETIVARKGEAFNISTCGQGVLLGSKLVGKER